MQELFRETGKALKELWELQWDHRRGRNDQVMKYLVSVGHQFTTIASLCGVFPNIHLPAYSISFTPCLLLHHFLFLTLSLSFFFVVILFSGWQPTPIFLPGQSHRQRKLTGYSPWGRKSRTQLRDFHFTISWTESETQPVRCMECRKQEMKRFLMNLWATVSQWTWQTI